MRRWRAAKVEDFTFQVSRDIENRTYLSEIRMTNSDHNDNNIQYVPDAFEVGELVYTQLEDLLHDVVEDE